MPTERASVVVCSFYTADAYYRRHAAKLRDNLARLGVRQVLEEIAKPPGADWADICRKKVAFLDRVCREHPGDRVFWIDVDCGLLSLPGYIANFTADLIGFQRGFAPPLSIGYANRSRFWEPCFLGINATAAARRFVSDAARREREVTKKATDDYFLEESWRVNAPSLSFQIIPSQAALARGPRIGSDVPAFFSFGASGNVADFKDEVMQHRNTGLEARARPLESVRRRVLHGVKRVERSLPRGSANTLRRLADQAGLTYLLTNGGNQDLLGAGPRRQFLSHLIVAAQRGDREAMARAYARLDALGLPTHQESAVRQVAEAFAAFATGGTGGEPVRLAWWPRPFPGNFGDWLSPFVVARRSGRPVTFAPPTARTSRPHLTCVGSIGRFIKPSSIVVGTGISSQEIELDRRARYFSVRGPLTAQLLAECGGPDVGSHGDPGALLRRLVPVRRGATNGRVALVRHFTQASLPVTLAENMDELSLLISHPGGLRAFAETLNRYDAVVTSAMHVMIACHSYGIPCALVTFEGLEDSVDGTGIKYRDYCLGAALERVHEPVVVGLNLRGVGLDGLISAERIGDAKLDEIEAAFEAGLQKYLELTS